MVAENKYDIRTMKNEFKPPEPVEDKDYYTDELYDRGNIIKGDD